MSFLTETMGVQSHRMRECVASEIVYIIYKYIYKYKCKYKYTYL